MMNSIIPRGLLSSIKKEVKTIFRHWGEISESALQQGLEEHRNHDSSPAQEELIERLLRAYHNAKKEQKDQPAPYQLSGQWLDTLRKRQPQYLKCLHNHDIKCLSDLLANFFRNQFSSGFIPSYENLFKAGKLVKRGFVINILKDYETWKAFVDHADLKDLNAPDCGNPWGYMLDGNLIMPVSFRHDYYSFHIHNLLKNLKSVVVAEIGGGFGGVASCVLRRIESVKYLDFDLPESILIISYYLLNIFPEKRFLLFGESESKILSPEVLASYDIILLPNFCLTRLESMSVDLFLNTRSMSEMNYDTVQEYVSEVSRLCKYYFLHDNSDESISKKGYAVPEIPASHFPVPRNFERIYKSISPWVAGAGRFREYLYLRANSQLNLSSER